MGSCKLSGNPDELLEWHPILGGGVSNTLAILNSKETWMSSHLGRPLGSSLDFTLLTWNVRFTMLLGSPFFLYYSDKFLWLVRAIFK